jgi:long-chain acyl-CoA synthetase
MYTGKHAHLRPLQPAFIMAGTGETVTYADLEARSNRLAHLFRKLGLKRLDHYAIFMENNSRYLEACGAGERSGLYYTCVNSYLTGSELAYIVANSESRVLITSVAKLEVARTALRECPKVELAACPGRRYRTNAPAPRCCTRRAPPAGQKAFCARFPNSRRPNSCRSSISCKSFGSTARA